MNMDDQEHHCETDWRYTREHERAMKLPKQHKVEHPYLDSAGKFDLRKWQAELDELIGIKP